jgi:hypothetical protein
MCNINLQKPKNASVDFGVLSHVEKAAYKCISTYLYLKKRPITHRDVFTPSIRKSSVRFFEFSKPKKPSKNSKNPQNFEILKARLFCWKTNYVQI